MAEMKFSDDFLDAAYKVLATSMFASAKESEQFSIMCEVCRKYDIRVIKFMQALNELNKRLEDFNDADD